MNERAMTSARRVLSQVIALVQPASIVDAGCGNGAWLAVAHELGVTDIFGIDGSGASLQTSVIPRDRLMLHDFSRPLQMNRRFDLVLSLEMAHYLKEDRVGNFLESLVSYGPVVLFSASIPGQGRLPDLNEQWPAYWGEHFDRLGYAAFDCIRDAIWDEPEVDWWYAQNTILYVDRDRLEEYPSLGETVPSSRLAARIHPILSNRDREWQEMREAAASILQRLVPERATIILPSAELIDLRIYESVHVRPFLERNGVDWGNPGNDRKAIDELERMREEGAEYFALVWCTRWWLDAYPDFVSYLRTKYRCILDEETVLFSLWK